MSKPDNYKIAEDLVLDFENDYEVRTILRTGQPDLSLVHRIAQALNDKVFVGLVLGLFGSVQIAFADFSDTVAGYNIERLATAIYFAEGGKKTAHPYGILTKYKHTTPRQACINTIRHKHKDWQDAGNPGNFLSYLQSRYAPIGAKNDPKGLNQNWLKNVRYYLNGGKNV